MCFSSSSIITMSSRSNRSSRMSSRSNRSSSRNSTNNSFRSHSSSRLCVIADNSKYLTMCIRIMKQSQKVNITVNTRVLSARRVAQCSSWLLRVKAFGNNKIKRKITVRCQVETSPLASKPNNCKLINKQDNSSSSSANREESLMHTKVNAPIKGATS